MKTKQCQNKLIMKTPDNTVRQHCESRRSGAGMPEPGLIAIYLLGLSLVVLQIRSML